MSAGSAHDSLEASSEKALAALFGLGKAKSRAPQMSVWGLNGLTRAAAGDDRRLVLEV